MLMASQEISKSLSGSLPIDGYHTVECELYIGDSLDQVRLLSNDHIYCLLSPKIQKGID